MLNIDHSLFSNDLDEYLHGYNNDYTWARLIKRIQTATGPFFFRLIAVPLRIYTFSFPGSTHIGEISLF